MRILGNFKGEPASLWYGSEAFGCNNKGQVVGWANGSDLLIDVWQACLWQNGKIVSLGSLSAYGASMGRSINDNGWVAGIATYKSGAVDNDHAFLYDFPNRKMIDLNVHYSHANSINASNEIAGGYYNAQGHLHALYFDGDRRSWDIHSKVTAGGTRSEASCINNKRQIVGWASDSSGVDHGFFYDLNTRVVKHVPFAQESRITSINNKGVAVGIYKYTLLSDRALIWNVNTGVAEDLNKRLRPEQRLPETSYPPPQHGWALLEAWGINDAGRITGYGTRAIKGIYYQRAFRLAPVLTQLDVDADQP
jgi:probable HAF family extracellular repeat protein